MPIYCDMVQKVALQDVTIGGNLMIGMRNLYISLNACELTISQNGKFLRGGEEMMLEMPGRRQVMFASPLRSMPYTRGREG